jgi:hypothetical protein
VSRRAGLLSAGHRESLERDGYLLVPSLLDESVLAPMRARLDELVYQTLVAWDAEPGQDVEERGVVHATGLSDPDFAPCREHPLLAEAAAAPLGPDWHLRGLELRPPLPGGVFCATWMALCLWPVRSCQWATYRRSGAGAGHRGWSRRSRTW